MTRTTLWRLSREDYAPMLLIVLLPLALALPQLLGWLKSDPMLYVGSMAQGVVRGIASGSSYIDPNRGFTTQALGYRAALEWLQANVPWWNPYSGVGLPLAAEYQPAVFFPLTLLLLLPTGLVWEHFMLQALAGWGTYVLLRQMGIARLAATTGGLLYAFNGTLAWFADAPTLPVPFLPWALLGVERARTKAALGLPGGWRVLALAMAMSLLAGFPETAYINGLLTLAWAVLRGVQTAPGRRISYASRIALGGSVGIALAAPQILAFFEFLPHADTGTHDGRFAHAAVGPVAMIPSLIAPYAYGPIFRYLGWGHNIWGAVGGYVTIIVLVAAIYGLIARRDGVGWLLFVWAALSIAKTFGQEPAVTLWNLVPGIAQIPFYRYAPPSWEFAFTILAARGVNSLTETGKSRLGPLLASGLVLLIAIVGSLSYGAQLWSLFLHEGPGLRDWALSSAFWAILTSLLCFVLLVRGSTQRAQLALAILLTVNSAFMFAIPTLSASRTGSVDTPAINFLRENLGLQRFYTLGPIQPNYGAYFGIASINHNYLPVSSRWVAWVKTHLDNAADPVVFNGNYARAADRPTQAQELRRNLPAYEWAGVKYVVAPGGQNPFVENGETTQKAAIKQVYADDLMSIFELPNPKPYFEALNGNCTVQAQARTQATINCVSEETLLRRELYFPGWTATVDGRNMPIVEYGGLFQAVALPKGTSEVRYNYAPPYIAWAWLAMACGFLALCFPVRRLFGPAKKIA